MNEIGYSWGYGNPMQYELQRQQYMINEEMRQDQRELAKAEKKAYLREKYKTWGLQERQHVHDQIEEARRSVYENVSIGGSGKIEIKTENLAIASSSRLISDLCSPKLIILQKANDLTEEIFCVMGVVKNKKTEMFLSPDRCGNGTYLLRKFNTSGVSIYAEAIKAKAYAGQLLRLLISNSTETQILSENPGWLLLPDGSIKLVDEGELLWSDAQKLSR